MKKGIFLLVILLILGGVIFVSAQDNPQDKDLDIPAGTEVIKVGGVKIFVPKGAKVQRQAGRIVVEDLTEFVGRKFAETDQRLFALEQKQQELEKKIEELKLLIEANQR